MKTTPLTSSALFYRRTPVAALFFSALAGTLGVGGCVEPDTSGGSCPSGHSLCGTVCMETISDPANCGTCGHPCRDGSLCSLGQCKSDCDGGLTQCGSACVDPLSSESHCGTCDEPCAAGMLCTNRVCTCPVGEPSCGGSATGGVSGTGGVVSTGTGGGGSVGSGPGTGGASTGGASTGGAPGGSGGMSSGGTAGSGGLGTGGVVNTCTNTLPTGTDWPEATCDMWHDAGNCDDAWFVEQDACNESCGRCTSSGAGSASGAGGAAADLGNPWGGVSAGQQGWASRYWDCCKQSCGWANNTGGNPVASCNSSGASKVSADDQSTCSGGQSTTCNSFTPWTYSKDVAFGFVAMHAGASAPCGQCYHVEFTGQGQHNASDPGSQAIAGKTMIVMATNIGGDVSGDGQMDFLIPGGGTGQFYGCGTAWGVGQSEVESLGAQYGGLRANCSGSDLNGIKSCVADKCQALFGSRGLSDMYEGCMWYVDWMQAADNPKFRYEPIDCPQELKSVAY